MAVIRSRPPSAGARTPRTAVVAARLAALVVVVVVVVVASASPAAADAAEPGDFRAEVTAIEPAVDGIGAEVFGGDAFLELRVDSGHTVEVPGYQGEPYLRFREDGTVEHNVNSPTTHLNEDRTGAVEPPAGASVDADPVWERVADDGRYAWHDHRVHWMGVASPPVDRGERVGGAYDPWRVPIVVDGEQVEIRGTLTYAESVSPLPWFAIAVAAAVLLAVAGQVTAEQVTPIRVAAASLVAAAALAAFTGRAEYIVSPAGAGANPLLWVLPVSALLTAVAALVLARRTVGAVAGLAAVAILAGWALLRLGVLLRPVLPSDVPDGVDRAGVALGFGVSAGAAWLLVTSGALALPALEDDEPTARGAAETRGPR